MKALRRASISLGAVLAGSALAAACTDETATIRLLAFSDAAPPDAGAGGRRGTGGTSHAGGTTMSSGGTRAVDAGECSTATEFTDCAAPLRHCYGATRTCVECVADEQCATHLCDSQWHDCAPCYRNSDCHGRTPYCSDDRRCVECITSDDCQPDEACSVESHSCAPKCHSDPDCSGSNRLHCATSTGVCVECRDSYDCRFPLPSCDARRGRCVECTSDMDCYGGRCALDRQNCASCPPGEVCSKPQP